MVSLEDMVKSMNANMVLIRVPSSDTSWNDVTDLPFSFSSHNCDQTDKDIAMGPTASKNFIFLLSLLIFSNF